MLRRRRNALSEINAERAARQAAARSGVTKT